MPVVITLAEPGSLLRVKVVDIQGEPIAGAFFEADTWRTHRSIHFRTETGPDGRVEWRSVPKDEVLYDIGKSEYMSIRHVALTASEREQTVILHPKLVISGRVTDAETGRLLPAFHVVQGQRFEKQARIDWSENAARTSRAGNIRASSVSRMCSFSFGWRLRVKAAQSRAFLSTEGSQTLTSPSNGRRGSLGSSCSRMGSRRREPRLRGHGTIEVSDLAFRPIGSRCEVSRSHDGDGRTIHVSIGDDKVLLVAICELAMSTLVRRIRQVRQARAATLGTDRRRSTDWSSVGVEPAGCVRTHPARRQRWILHLRQSHDMER